MYIICLSTQKNSTLEIGYGRQVDTGELVPCVRECRKPLSGMPGLVCTAVYAWYSFPIHWLQYWVTIDSHTTSLNQLNLHDRFFCSWWKHIIKTHYAILGLWWGKTQVPMICNFNIVGCQWTVNCLLGTLCGLFGSFSTSYFKVMCKKLFPEIIITHWVTTIVPSCFCIVLFVCKHLCRGPQIWGDTLVPCNAIYKHRDQRFGTMAVTQCD